MDKEQFLKITNLDEYEISLTGKKRVGTQLKLNKFMSNADSERMNKLQKNDGVESEAASPIMPISAAIDKEQPPRLFGKTKEVVNLNKKLGSFKTYRMNRSNWENQSKAVSGQTGGLKKMDKEKFMEVTQIDEYLQYLDELGTAAKVGIGTAVGLGALGYGAYRAVKGAVKLPFRAVGGAAGLTVGAARGAKNLVKGAYRKAGGVPREEPDEK